MAQESRHSPPQRLELPSRVDSAFGDRLEEFANATGAGVAYQMVRELDAGGAPVAARLEVVDRGRLEARRRKELDALHLRRDQLQREIDEIDLRIARLRGTAPPPEARGNREARGEDPPPSTPIRSAGRGPRGDGENLHDYLRRVLATAHRPLRVADLEEAVLQAGYVSSSKRFRAVIVQRLANMSDVERVGRGLYALTGKA